MPPADQINSSKQVMPNHVHASQQALPRGFAEHEHPREAATHLIDEADNKRA